MNFNKLTKAVCVALCCMTVCTFSSGCGLSEMKKTVEISIKTPAITLDVPFIDPDVQASAQFLEKAAQAFSEQYAGADVRITVIQYDNAEETAAIEKCFDTSDSTDVLFNDYFTMESHIHTGRVVPLDDIITPEIQNDIAHVFLSHSKANGKTYMMPYLYRQNVLAYNKDIFRSAGLYEFISGDDVIQTWSMEEWETILEKLREYMPETSFPLPLYAKNNQGDTHIMTYIRSQGSSFFDENGYFNLETPEGIAGLEWIKNCIDKGYMSDNSAYRDILDNFDLWLNGQLAFFVANLGNIQNFECDYGLVNFPCVSGGLSTNFLTGFEVFDNGDKDRLDAAKAFVKFIYESDYLDYSASAIPCSDKIFKKYSYALGRVEKYIDNSDTGVIFTGGNPNWLGVRSVFYKHMKELINGTRTPSQVAADLDKDCNAAIKDGYENSVFHE